MADLIRVKFTDPNAYRLARYTRAIAEQVTDWIEFYPGGGHRIVSVRGLHGLPNCTPPADNKTHVFSNSARRRFFKHCMSLDFDGTGLLPLFCTLTFPREIQLEKHLTLARYKKLIKRFMQSLSRAGVDTVIKTEFTKDFYPHLHCIFIISRESEFFNSHISPAGIRGISRDFRLRDFQSWIFREWLDHLYRYIVIDTDIPPLDFWGFIREKMTVAFSGVDPVRTSYGRAIYYLAKYTTRNDNGKLYQNILPTGWEGLRFTSKSHANFPWLKSTPRRVPIAPELFDVCRDLYVSRCRERYGLKSDQKIKYVNGFWLDGVDDIIQAYRNKFAEVIPF